MSEKTSQEEEKWKREDYILSFKFFFILVFNHFFLKAYKVVSSSEYPLYSFVGLPKAGGGGQVPLSPAQPHFSEL